MSTDHPKRRATDYMECETCDQHGEFSTMLTTAMADLKWIRWTGYGILCVTGSFLLTIWSVLYPQIMSISEQLNHMRTNIEVNTREIAALKGADVESKADRKELKSAIEQMWKGNK
jgi:hypothetical protein